MNNMTDQQLRTLEYVATRISFSTPYHAQVVDGILYTQYLKIYFVGEHLINPQSLPPSIRTIINEVNGL